MPKYLGLPQAELVNSIKNAFALLETHSTGPECQKRIDDLRAGQPSPLAQIENAADDQALASAVRSSGVTGFFSRIGELLRYHAAVDTDGQGTDVMTSLQSWNALGTAYTLEYSPMNAEVDSFLAAQHAREAKAGLKDAFLTPLVMRELSTDRASIARARKVIKSMTQQAKAGADDETLRQAFLENNDLHIRHIVSGMLEFKSHLYDQEAATPAAEPVMQRYVVVVPGLREGKVDMRGPEVTALRDKLNEVLDPFFDLDEIGLTGIGYAGQGEKAPLGIIFDSTKRVAQTVANALPDQAVLDAQNNPVVAAKSSPAPKDPKGPKGGFQL